jgi:mono/diheme cytochrome c family protein
MRKRTLLLSITVACIAAAAAFGWVTIRRGFSARDNPAAIETLIATTARQLAVPSQYRQLGNPLSSSSDLHACMEHFADHCATCHADDGSGDMLFGKGLYPKPPDMRQKETQNKSDGELYYTIENGIRLLQVVGNLREPNHNRSVIRSAERPSRRHDGACNPHGGWLSFQNSRS